MTATRTRAAHLGPRRRRPMILDAALEQFLARGYEATSMESIARAAGVSKPVVYDCYPSKEELFKALLQREERRLLAHIAESIPADVGADPERTLADGFTAFLRAVAASPQAYRVIFLGEGGANAAVARRVQRGREQAVTAATTLARAWLQGRGRREDTDTAALLIAQSVVALAEAGARTMLAAPDQWTAEALGRTLGGLAARAQDAV